MSHKWVVETCQQLLSSFDKRRHTPETHFEKAVTRLKCPDEESMQLLRTLYEGCFLRDKGVKALLDNFYADKAGSVLRSDFQLFRVFGYAAAFGLEDLGFEVFSALVRSQDAGKMYHIVSYVFDEHNLQHHLKADWMKVYDLTFIEETLTARIQNHAKQAQQLCASLERKALGSTGKPDGAAPAEGTSKTHKTSTTRPVSPNITKPRPPRVPEPFAIYEKVRMECSKHVKIHWRRVLSHADVWIGSRCCLRTWPGLEQPRTRVGVQHVAGGH